MTSSSILSVVTFVYGLAAFFYLAGWVFQKPLAGRMGTWVSFIGLAGNVAGIALRWVESYRMGIGHAPLSNLYESLVFFACVLTICCLVGNGAAAAGSPALLSPPWPFWPWPMHRCRPTSAIAFSR